MPSWGIHLVTANEILNKINIIDKNSFLIGNFLPDAERYVIDDFSIFVPYEVSHYAEKQNINGNLEKLPNVNKFYEKYRKNTKNPLIIGYLVHLLTDYYWNNLTNQRYTIRDELGNCIGIKLNTGEEIKADKVIRRNLKHNDFYLFENELTYLYKYTLPKYNLNILENLQDIEETKYNKEDIVKIINFLNNKYGRIKENNKTNNYRLYTKEQMKIDFNSSIEFIVDFLKINDIV